MDGQIPEAVKGHALEADAENAGQEPAENEEGGDFQRKSEPRDLKNTVVEIEDGEFDAGHGGNVAT